MSNHELDPADVPDRGGMPMLGLGTWENITECADTVQTALDMGYRHVDTAQRYHNEEAVGDGIRAADVPRDDVFLATKVWIDRLGHDDVHASVSESLERLGTDYIDLLYVHWPGGEYDPEETLPAFAELKDDGVIDRIGISNFEPRHCDTALDVLDGDVFANQIEIHPHLQQDELREYAAERDIELVAYSPLARARVLDMPELVEIASKHDISEAQVALAWLREKGITAVPKATGASHLRDNLSSLSVELDAEDVETIDEIDEYDRLFYEDFGPDWK